MRLKPGDSVSHHAQGISVMTGTPFSVVGISAAWSPGIYGVSRRVTAETSDNAIYHAVGDRGQGKAASMPRHRSRSRREGPPPEIVFAKRVVKASRENEMSYQQMRSPSILCDAFVPSLMYESERNK